MWYIVVFICIVVVTVIYVLKLRFLSEVLVILFTLLLFTVSVVIDVIFYFMSPKGGSEIRTGRWVVSPLKIHIHSF